ncbi:MAG: GGDEF domain-containing protein [Clostridiales bacterium]|nr:GGDEF domain-containing protein [Clostridiales bacterium]
MKLKTHAKQFLDTVLYQSAAQNQEARESRAIGVVSLVLSAITAIMSFLNYFQRQYEMMVATAVLTLVLVCIFVFSLLVKIRRIVDVMLCVALSMLCVYFALTGGNDGFAILWALLFPPSTMLFMDFIYVASIGLFFELFFFVLFWTPLNAFVSAYYTPVFMLRFPMLYTAFFALSILAKYLMTKQKIAEDNYIQTIENLSMIDQLTNIANRRSFEERLRLEWNRAIRNKEPISILFTDVDKFKSFNDTYGHLIGDRVLQIIAAGFTKALKRSLDFAARWGGEEFAMLLPNTEGEQAFQIAEKIRLQIAETPVPLDDGQMTNVTISIGIHTLTPSLDSSMDDFINHADEALYTAKHEGRNRACRYPA